MNLDTPAAEKKKLLRLAGEVARRAGGVSHPRIIPQGKQNGHYDPPHGEQNGHYGRVGVRPPPPLRGSSPCEAGQFIPADFDCRHSEVCKSRNSVLLNSFFQMVLNPQECGLFRFQGELLSFATLNETTPDLAMQNGQIGRFSY